MHLGHDSRTDAVGSGIDLLKKPLTTGRVVPVDFEDCVVDGADDVSASLVLWQSYV